MQALSCDRYAEWKITFRPLEVAAALVATPEQQNLAHFYAAIEHGAVFAIARRKHVVRLHRCSNANVGCFVSQT